MFYAMTQVGQNWNQLISVMNQWYQLGRDLENAPNSEENQVLELA